MSKPHFTYAMSYGFMEGQGHSRPLQKILNMAGYKPTTINSADIIIAHSAGCWLIPKDAQPKLVIYFGMPLVLVRPRRTWVRATLPKLKNRNLRRELLARVNNSYYGVRHLKRNVGIMRYPKIAQPTIFPKAQSIFIANRHDPWPRGPELQKLVKSQDWTFLSLSGGHEDIWHHSDHYITIINHYAELLAQTIG